MQQNYPFQPFGANTATTPTAQVGKITLSVAVQTFTFDMPAEGGSIRITTTGNCAWSLGAASGLTIDNGEYMLAGATEVFGIPGGKLTFAAIGEAATGTIRVHAGIGS